MGGLLLSCELNAVNQQKKKEEKILLKAIFLPSRSQQKPMFQPWWPTASNLNHRPGPIWIPGVNTKKRSCLEGNRVRPVVLNSGRGTFLSLWEKPHLPIHSL